MCNSLLHSCHKELKFVTLLCKKKPLTKFYTIILAPERQATLKERNCPKPDLKHGSVKVYRKGYQSVAVYDCDDSDSDLLNARTVRYCQVDGTWSGTPQSCKSK